MADAHGEYGPVSGLNCLGLRKYCCKWCSLVRSGRSSCTIYSGDWQDLRNSEYGLQISSEIAGFCMDDIKQDNLFSSPLLRRCCCLKGQVNSLGCFGCRVCLSIHREIGLGANIKDHLVHAPVPRKAQLSL